MTSNRKVWMSSNDNWRLHVEIQRTYTQKKCFFLLPVPHLPDLVNPLSHMTAQVNVAERGPRGAGLPKSIFTAAAGRRLSFRGESLLISASSRTRALHTPSTALRQPNPSFSTANNNVHRLHLNHPRRHPQKLNPSSQVPMVVGLWNSRFLKL